MINSLQILTTNSAIETSRSIAENGLLITISAFAIIIGFGIIALILKQYYKFISTAIKDKDTIQSLFNQYTEQQNIINAKQIEINNNMLVFIKEQQAVITDEAKRNITESQAKIILSNCFDTNKLMLLKEMWLIIDQNHIDNKDNVHRKIRRIISNMIEKRNILLSNFILNGMKLSDYVDDNEYESKFNVLQNYIYTKNRSSSILVKDLDILYDDMLNATLKKIK